MKIDSEKTKWGASINANIYTHTEAFVVKAMYVACRSW